MTEAVAKKGHSASGRHAPTSMGPSGPLIDTIEAAARLGVTPRFVRRLVDERRIPFHKIGKYVRFDPADIDRFAIDGRVEAFGNNWLRSA